MRKAIVYHIETSECDAGKRNALDGTALRHWGSEIGKVAVRSEIVNNDHKASELSSAKRQK
ncbi:hypothetical protein NBRC116589_20110 [Ruegeria sp. HU-ET01832]